MAANAATDSTANRAIVTRSSSGKFKLFRFGGTRCTRGLRQALPDPLLSGTAAAEAAVSYDATEHHPARLKPHHFPNRRFRC